MFQKLEPFWIGGILALLLNMPLDFIERKCLCIVGNGRIRRILALLMAMALLLLSMACLTLIFIPKIMDLTIIMKHQIPKFYRMISGEDEKGGVLVTDFADIWRMLPSFMDRVMSMATKIGNVLSNLFSHLTDFCMGLIWAIYLLLDKERVKKNTCRILNFTMPDWIVEIETEFAGTWYEKCKCFLMGQCIEAVIFGSILCILLHIFCIPFANAVAALLAVCALVPVVGPLIGSFFAALLILSVSPMKMILFWGIYLGLQQIEGNFIYPKVVGNSVGLSAFSLFTAVLLGSRIGGFFGIFLTIPTFAAAKELLNQNNCRNFLKKIKNNT